MITRDKFDTLPAVEKVHTVFEFGEEIDHRVNGDFRMKLYLINDFYVELYYNATRLQIGKMISISTEEVVELYYDQIDISDVFSG
jgi:hypothetical protein